VVEHILPAELKREIDELFLAGSCALVMLDWSLLG
jgi:hypothetical protein